LLLDTAHTGLSPWAEVMMYAADRAEHVAAVIMPALARGTIVVTDRYVDSTLAYQGGGRQLGSEIVRELHRVICGNLQPDITILLLPSLNASLARARRRNTREEAQTGKDENRFELEQDGFHRRVWEKYHEIAEREPQRVVLIEGNMSIDQIHQKIVQAISEKMLILKQA